MAYLDTEEVNAILRQPDRSTPEGLRDETLLEEKTRNGILRTLSGRHGE
jgi:hypothetical protein